MRIIGGAWGGRRIVTPKGTSTRPTSDRVREALFSILGPLDGERVLDLFAGSGALGLEALSRGAGSATFVDRAPAAINAVRANLDTVGGEAEVLRVDVRSFLRDAPGRGAIYDLVFLDPPYGEAVRLGPELELRGLLGPGARVVSESDRRSPLDLGLDVSDERRYGDTLIRLHHI